jgi:antitoxin (DNA-binding transcriptional repressor) of toxin-antitoxin stability system
MPYLIRIIVGFLLRGKPLAMHREWCHNRGMPSINTRQFRNAKQLIAWLDAGETVELRERGEVIARIVPEVSISQPAEWPDFAALRKEIFGDRILPGTTLLFKERGRY